MTKEAKRNDPSIQIAIGAKTGSTGITGITMIRRKKNRRRNTGATAAIVKATTGMTTTVRRTSVVASMSLAANINCIGINGVTTRVQKMTDTRSREGTNSKHLAIAKV